MIISMAIPIETSVASELVSSRIDPDMIIVYGRGLVDKHYCSIHDTYTVLDNPRPYELTEVFNPQYRYWVN